MNITINEVLNRGVEGILPSKEGLASLMAKKKITLYQGFDPSGPSLHIGHWAGIRKLAQFQHLGHKVIFLIGDFTGMIGDPTDKKAARQRLTRKQVLTNLKNYKKQASALLNFEGQNKAEVMFNYSWLSKLNFEEIIELSTHFTVQQMIERDFFQKRLKNKKPIYLHEFLYPLMQGYDSVAMDVDLEIGATDQLFNMLAGRSLMKEINGKEKFVMTLKLLEDPTGKKMGKSEGNAINLDESNVEIFGKIMSLPDGFIERGIEILTDLPLDLSQKSSPLEAKKRLAFEVVKQVSGEKNAKQAQTEFEKTFQDRGVPSKIPTITLTDKSMPLLDLVFATKMVESRSEAKRLILQKAVEIDNQVVANPHQEIDLPKTGIIVKIGKRKFIKVVHA